MESRYLRIAVGTVVITVLTCAAVIGVDWVWQAGASSQLVASTFGDPTIRVTASLPRGPGRAPIYKVSTPITPEELQQVLPGHVRHSEGWLYWRGDSALRPVEVMRRLNPGVSWRAADGQLGPVAPGPAFGIDTAGLPSAFTGSAASCASFGVYLQRGGRLTLLGIPDHRIVVEGSTKVIPAGKALLRLVHHAPGTTVLTPSVPLLPYRLTGARIVRPGPVTEVQLVAGVDPADPSRSRPVWVFRGVGEVPAAP